MLAQNTIHLMERPTLPPLAVALLVFPLWLPQLLLEVVTVGFGIVIALGPQTPLVMET